MAEDWRVITDRDGWSRVVRGTAHELWRYAWEAKERADELNRREAEKQPPAKHRTDHG